MSVRCWHGLFFFHTPLPALIFCPHLLYKPVLEYRDKLFTHSNQKPASKERIHHQGMVKLSLSLSASPSKASSSVSSLSNLLINQVMYCMSSCCKTPYKHLVRHSTNWLCGCSSGTCGFSQTKAAALMWVLPQLKLARQAWLWSVTRRKGSCLSWRSSHESNKMRPLWSCFLVLYSVNLTERV